MLEVMYDAADVAGHLGMLISPIQFQALCNPCLQNHDDSLA